MSAENDPVWQHLLAIAATVSRDYPDAVFIGGVAVAAYSQKLGDVFVEGSHDADFFLSLNGKAALRDRYEVRRNHHLAKDSVVIEGEDLDLYVEQQNALGVPYDDISAHAEEQKGIRVAALEHLLILKLDAAIDRIGSGKGEKDVRDLARIVALLDKPRKALLKSYLTPERTTALNRMLGRPDLPQLLGLNPHDGSRFRKTLDAQRKAIERIGGDDFSGF